MGDRILVIDSSCAIIYFSPNNNGSSSSIIRKRRFVFRKIFSHFPFFFLFRSIFISSMSAMKKEIFLFHFAISDDKKKNSDCSFPSSVSSAYFHLIRTSFYRRKDDADEENNTQRIVQNGKSCLKLLPSSSSSSQFQFRLHDSHSCHIRQDRAVRVSCKLIWN